MLLDDKNAVIYGGGGTVGRAVAVAFAREGATVHLAGRTPEKLERVASEIRRAGGTAHIAVLDVLDERAVDVHAESVAGRAGSIDISINPRLSPILRSMSRSGGVRRHLGMKEITIIGSTGVIGRRAVRELLAAGHRVTGVTRSARGRERLESLGARAVEAEVFDEGSLRRAFDGAHAVVNLLTHIPSAVRMADRSAWEENDRVRTEGSAAIARAAQAARVQRLVQESIAFVCSARKPRTHSWRPRQFRARGFGLFACSFAAIELAQQGRKQHSRVSLARPLLRANSISSLVRARSAERRFRTKGGISSVSGESASMATNQQSGGGSVCRGSGYRDATGVRLDYGAAGSAGSTTLRRSRVFRRRQRQSSR